MENYYEINRQSWNWKTGIHAKSKFYDLEEFKKGTTSLKGVELKEVGDVKGKSLIHLQCHFGMDTLSWARLGAQVTGVDISDKSIDTAQNLAKELNLDANFIRCNIYDIPKVIDKTFDIVYTSYGALNWLDDLDKWAQIVSSLLKPGGVFHIIEFHPYIYTLNEEFNITESYFYTKEPIDSTSEETYTDGENLVAFRCIEWHHSLSEIINALLSQKLQLEYLKEFPYQVYNCFKNMEELEVGKFVFKGPGTKIPYMFSIKAVKN
jgi:ubiquinone/menaquinone biosynthesis C-methylase UbiE